MKRILLAAASTLLVTSVAYASIPENAYLWVHPKLGPILVDKMTNAPVRSTSAVSAESAPKVSSRTEAK